MRLKVRHSTSYDYAAPLVYSVNRLYLWPSEFDTQKIESWSITAPGMEHALAYADGFGNRVHLLTFGEVFGPVSIVAEGVMITEDAAGVVRGLPGSAPDAVLLRQTKLTRPSAAILSMSDRIFRVQEDPLASLHALMEDIHRRVAYVLGASDSRTTAAEAFANGRGVCQDHAHVFVGAARSNGVPARYVTGYLVTGEGASSTAAHAWAEALVPDLGWVGFDPANNACPTDHYVRVAAGIDAAAVAPIRGSRRGGEQESLTVEVRVEFAQQ